MRVRVLAVAFGAVFGFAISWGQFTSPDRIRDMLLLEDPYLYLMMGTAVGIGLLGTRLLRIPWDRSKPETRHVAGSVLFGLGWAISDSCPGPIAAQLAQGFAWSLFTAAGVGAGVLAFLAWQERRAGAPVPEAA